MDSNWIWIALIVVAISLWVSAGLLRRRRQRLQREARFAELMAKYNDQQVVVAIMNGSVWQGMSQEQLVDSRGQPEDKDQIVYKTKTKQTWKYGRVGKNRFRERIYVENGTVVGWKD
jgi:ribosomal protein L21E